MQEERRESLAKRLKQGADNCRQLAEAAGEPFMQSTYRDLATSYDGLAACLTEPHSAGRRIKTLMLRRAR